MRWFLLLVATSACTGSYATRVARPSRLSSTVSCGGRDGGLDCLFPRGADFIRVGRARAIAPRVGGGLFVLRADGTIDRYDREGFITGQSSVGLRSLVAAGRYACGTMEVGGGDDVVCFRDANEDMTCGAASFEPDLHALGIGAVADLAGSSTGPVFAVIHDADVLSPRRYALSGSCGQHCVSFGCDSEPRCVDPCRPGRHPTLSARPLPRRSTK